MMIVTTRFTKKKAVLAVLLLGLVMALAIIFVSAHDTARLEDETYCLNTNEARVDYLNSLGWQVEQEPLETLQFQLPEQLEEPYLSYNELQDAQGFDLSTACGKQVARFTYAVTNYPDRSEGVQLNLYVCEDQPIAGDVFCAGPGGFQKTLVYPED